MSSTGAAARDGRLQVGMRILEVGNHSLLGMTHTEAVRVLRSTGDTLMLLVCDGFDPRTVTGIEVSAYVNVDADQGDLLITVSATPTLWRYYLEQQRMTNTHTLAFQWPVLYAAIFRPGQLTANICVHRPPPVSSPTHLRVELFGRTAWRASRRSTVT